jgi:hypothetical protein
VGDLSVFSEDDEGLKSRTGGRDLALELDEGPILFGVHFQSTHQRKDARTRSRTSGVFSTIPPPNTIASACLG